MIISVEQSELLKMIAKLFWKSCKPFFSSSSPNKTQFTRNNNGQIIQNSSEMANILNVHYNKSLNLRLIVNL